MPTKRILLISTGGTIGGKISKSKKNDQNSQATAADFNATVEHTKKRIKKMWGIDLHIQPCALEDAKGEEVNVDSSDIVPEHWTLLSEKVKEEYDNYDAFIIAHGTNSLGYTSSALSFVLTNINKPVILTGSQVPFGALGSDALMNLDNCLRVAVWPYNLIKGVIVVFGSSIITGTHAKKINDFDYDAFKSFSSGNIGKVGRIVIMRKELLERHNKYYEPDEYDIAVTSSRLRILNQFETNIVSLTEFPGMEPSILRHLLDHSNVKGVILRSFGAGDPSSRLRSVFEYLKDSNIPLIISTQCHYGNANFQVNESGFRLRKRDLAIPSFNMSAESQVTKLSWLLGQKLSYQEIKNAFAIDFKGEIEVIRERKQ